MEICYNQIGIIHTSYENSGNVPIQGIFFPDSAGRVVLFDEYADGLLDIEGFSHIILIYHFHLCKEKRLIVRPYMENKEHGIFAIRSPKRPNAIGLSVVRLLGREGNELIVGEVDMLDGTPLLDIKPYVSYFDYRENTRTGWVTEDIINRSDKLSHGKS